MIDGVEYPGVKFVSLSPQWANHVKNFTVQAFACENDTAAPREQFYSSSGSAGGGGGGGGMGGDRAFLSGPASTSTNSLPLSTGLQASTSGSGGGGTSTTPGSNRGSPVLTGSQAVAFPPLNLNGLGKVPGSPLTSATLKHSGMMIPTTGSSTGNSSNALDL